MNEAHILIRLLWMYIPRNWEFGSALAKLRNFGLRYATDHGGSCILVKKVVLTKELKFVEEIGEEKSFELSAIELVKYAIIIICIYRSPDGKIDTF
jgi:hypothetical protein